MITRLGWPLAGATVSLAVVVALILFDRGRDESEAPPEVVRREQPELTFVGEGDGWRLLVDQTAAVPEPEEAALAVRWDGLATEVVLIEAATGRVAARWETGYRPTAVFRPSRNEVLISHHPIDAQGQPGEPVLLRISLDNLEGPPEVRQLPGRVNYTVGITELALSVDERWLFYVAEAYPDCVVDRKGYRNLLACDQNRVGVVNLDSPKAAVARYVVGNACYQFEDDPNNAAGVVLVCRNNQKSPGGPIQYFAVDADGAFELASSPAFAGSAGSHLLADGRLLATTVINQYEAEEGLTLIVHPPPFPAPPAADWPKQWPFPGLASVVPLAEPGPGTVLGVMRDGRLAVIDLDSGAMTELPYGLTPAPLDDWLLVR